MEIWQIETSWHTSITNRRGLLASPFQKRHRSPQSLLCFFQSVSHTHPDQAPEGIGFCRSNFVFWTIGNLVLSSRKSKEYSESHGGWVQVLAYPSITFVPYYASVSLFGVWALLSKHYKIGMLTHTCQRSHRTKKVWDALGLSQHHCTACVLKSTLTPNSCLHTYSRGVYTPETRPSPRPCWRPYTLFSWVISGNKAYKIVSKQAVCFPMPVFTKHL